MTRPEDSYASFPSTNWSLIERAIHDPEALNEFVQIYWVPMRSFLVRLRVPYPQAEDQVQQFIVQKILGGNLLKHADAQVGNFRSLLKSSMKRFAIDCYRRETAKRSGPRVERSLDESAIPDPIEEQEAVDIFDFQWAQMIVGRTLHRVRAGCVAVQWQVFVARFWIPLTQGVDAVPYKELQRQLGYQDSKELANFLVNVKRQFSKVLREVVGEYTTGETAIEAELTELCRVLSSRSAIKWRHLLEEHPGEQSQQAGELESNLEASSLTAALDINIETGCDSDDLAGILEYYLDLSVADFPGVRESKPTRLVEETSPAVETTLSELLRAATPSIDLLQTIKQAARAELRRADQRMPRRIAEVIYFSAIAAAIAHNATRISSNPASVLRSGLEMQLNHSWLPAWQRELLDAAHRHLLQE